MNLHVRTAAYSVLFLLGQSALAQDSAVQQLLEISFSCPVDAYEVPAGYYLKILNRYHWEGSASEFKVRIDMRRLAPESDKPEVSKETFVLWAKMSDIGEVFVRDGVDVNVRCKNGQLCFLGYFVGRGGHSHEPGEVFHVCDASTADDIKVALQRLIGTR